MSGWTLPAEKAANWTYEVARQKFDKPEFPSNLREFKKLVEPKVVVLLEERGFFFNTMGKTKDTKKYFKPMEGGGLTLSITYCCARLTQNFKILASLTVNYSACESILSNFGFVGTNAVIVLPFHIFLQSKDIRWEISSHDDIDFVIKAFSKAFLRVADNFLTLKGIDKVLNGNGCIKARDYHLRLAGQPHCLVIAKLAGNPNFEQLAIDLKNAGDPAGNAPIMDEEWPKLVDYLRNHVKPLV